MEIDKLKKEKDEYMTKVFWLCLKIIFIFLIPALLGVWIGKKIDNYYNSGDQKFAPLVLLFTFIFSWIIVFIYYKNFSKKIKNVENQIKEELNNN